MPYITDIFYDCKAKCEAFMEIYINGQLKLTEKQSEGLKFICDSVNEGSAKIEAHDNMTALLSAYVNSHTIGEGETVINFKDFISALKYIYKHSNLDKCLEPVISAV